MENNTNKRDTVEKVARVWTMLILAIVVLIFLIELIFPHTESEIIPFGVLLGEVLAFKHALLGG